jgi:hypothetical protein
VSYPATPTYWLEATDEVAIGLRRYRSGEGSDCASGYHSALVYTGTAPARWRDTDHGRVLDGQPAAARDDPRWPTACDQGCGYRFVDDDHRQDWQELLYRRADTGELVTLRTQQADRDAPTPAGPGACWDAWWMSVGWRGPDGIALMVRLPNGRDWSVDGRASNCTMPDDRVHKCWVRHGDPRACNLTVDKAGYTCAAGAGSIQADDYHGFLQNGILTAG